MIVCYSCPQLIPVITLRMKIQNVRMKIQDVRMKIQDVRMKIKVALFSHLVSSFCIFIFWSFLWCHHPNFRWIFHDNSKNNNRRIFLVSFPFYSAHSASSIKTGTKTEREVGVCIPLDGKRPVKVMKSTVNWTAMDNIWRMLYLNNKTVFINKKAPRSGLSYDI